MKKERTYSVLAKEAARLLGAEIKLARKEREWSEGELAERVGITRATLQKIEKGDMTTAMGLVFEAASIVGLNLLGGEDTSLSERSNRAELHATLLPQTRKRKKDKAVDDDF